MTLVDSADSILMLYSYADFPERGFAIFEKRGSTNISSQSSKSSLSEQGAQASRPATNVDEQEDEIRPVSPGHKQPISSQPSLPDLERSASNDGSVDIERRNEIDNGVSVEHQRTLEQAAKNTMSGLSIVLTLMSILVAFR